MPSESMIRDYSRESYDFQQKKRQFPASQLLHLYKNPRVPGFLYNCPGYGIDVIHDLRDDGSTGSPICSRLSSRSVITSSNLANESYCPDMPTSSRRKGIAPATEVRSCRRRREACLLFPSRCRQIRHQIETQTPTDKTSYRAVVREDAPIGTP